MELDTSSLRALSIWRVAVRRQGEISLFVRKESQMEAMPQEFSDFSVAELRAELEGEVIGPDDPAYDEARQVFFKGFDRRPAAVVRAAGAEDVSRIVSLARENGLELSVRSGSPSRAGYGTSDGGIVIDLSGMRAVDIDADARTAWVETGITAAEYTNATSQH